MKPIQIGAVRSDAPGFARGMLQVGWLPDGLPMEIPVVVARGAQDGPVLWLHGCVHGNEYCGAYIIHALLRALDPGKLKGAVVALPALNITAFNMRQRMSPFEGYNGGDLNRCFPGRPDGTLTEQIASAVWRHLHEYADAFVDFHTAFTADVRWALFAKADGATGSRSEAMARAFGLAHTLPAPMDILGGSAMIAAARQGIPSMIVEIGGVGQAFEPEAVQEGRARLENVMRSLGMIEGALRDWGPMTFFSNFAWVNATRGGIYRPVAKCGQTIAEGDVVGRFYDLHGDLVEEAKAPASGIVLAVNPGPLMPGGDILVHIGLEPRAA